jgi:hypothetical protein
LRFAFGSALCPLDVREYLLLFVFVCVHEGLGTSTTPRCRHFPIADDRRRCFWRRIDGRVVNTARAWDIPLDNAGSIRIWFGFVDGMFIDGDSEVRSLFAIGIVKVTISVCVPRHITLGIRPFSVSPML